MAWRKIGETTGSTEIAKLARQAKRNSAIASAIEEVLPEWLDASALRCLINPDGTVTIQAKPSMKLQLRQILPAVKLRLVEMGVKRVAVETKQNQ